MTNEGKPQEEWKTYLKVKATYDALNWGLERDMYHGVSKLSSSSEDVA